MSADAVEAVAAKVRAALETADPQQFASVLDPHVTWGAPGDGSPACQNRQQVLAWYERGRAGGRRGRVLDVTANGDKILVAMTVTSAAERTGVERWQVLKVVDGKVADIRGYDDEAAALAAAGLGRGA